MEPQIIIRRTNTSDAKYQQVYDLREEVLRKPIGLSLKNEDLSADALDIIFVAEVDDKIIGCVMLQHTADSKSLKLRQMAVYDDWQGKNVGRKLIEAAEAYSAAQKKKRIVLHARVIAVPFYEKQGYAITSDYFFEVGIPHVIMQKELS